MNTNIHNKVTVSLEVWPDAELFVQPGDLERFVPGGIGLSGPLPLRPWDDPLRDNPAEYYGFEPHSSHPLLGAPLNMPAGGVVYFENAGSTERIDAVGRLMGIRMDETRYAVFVSESPHPQQQRYIVQLRIVSDLAMRYLFEVPAPGGESSFPEQPLTIGELLWAFIRDQSDVWGTGMGGKLTGLMGGDGDWAKEALCFGLFVENSYHGVYRIWSRAWLVTK